jgi:hypothetical protein
MNKWLIAGSVIVVVAVVAVVGFGAVALAQGPQPPTPGTGGWGPHMGGGLGMGGFGGMMGGAQYSLVAVAAKTLNISEADLLKELQNGKAIADVAKSKGVALDKIVDAFVAPRVPMMQSMVSSGRITQEQMNTMLATMKANITAQLSNKYTPNGFGMMGSGFMDADSDGVCDFGETNVPIMPMMQRGRVTR